MHTNKISSQRKGAEGSANFLPALACAREPLERLAMRAADGLSDAGRRMRRHTTYGVLALAYGPKSAKPLITLHSPFNIIRVMRYWGKI